MTCYMFAESTDIPSHFANREIHRRATEARETTLRELAAGLGMDLAYLRERRRVGQDRLDAAHARENARIASGAKERRGMDGILADAIENAVKGTP